MKIKSLLGTLALSLGLLASPAAAEKFVVGFQPYDTISYQAIVNAELELWKKYTPTGTEIEFQPCKAPSSPTTCWRTRRRSAI